MLLLDRPRRKLLFIAGEQDCSSAKVAAFMGNSFGRILRVLIASTVGTAVLLPIARRMNTQVVVADAIGVSEAPPDPARADLRLRITLNGQQGFIDGNGRLVIPPTYAMVMPFSEGFAAIAQRSDGGRKTSWQFINPQGSVVIARIFDGVRIGAFHEGLAPLFADRKCGFIDTRGNVAIAPTFDEVSDFSTGLAAVRTGNAWGIIDRAGHVVLPPTYNFIGEFVSDRAIVAVGDQFGYIDRAGHIVVQPQFDRVNDFSEGLACVQNSVPHTRNFLTRYIDASGRVVIPAKKIDSGQFHEGLAAVKDTAGGYFIDRTGNVALQPAGAGMVGSFADGLASVQLGGRFGFIDHAGRTILAPKWDIVGDFDHGICKVMADNFRGYIDTAGEYVWKQQLQ